MTKGTVPIAIKIRKIVVSCCLLLLVLVALYVSIARQLVVWVSDYKLQLQNTLAETLKTPVSIGELKGTWDIFSPTLTAYNVHIGNQEQKLEVDQLTLEVDIPQSILNWQIRVDTIHAENLQLQIRENSPDIWSIGGIPRGKDPITPELILTQLQRFEKISISNSTISIHPYKQLVRTFTHINATLTHFNDEDMRLDGILYVDDEQPLVVSATASIEPSEWQKFSGELYVNIPYLDWQSWIPLDIELPWQVTELKLGGQIWATAKRGKLYSATVNTQGSQLTVQSKPKQTVTIEDIHLQAWLNSNYKDHVTLQIDDLSFTTNKTPFEKINLFAEQRIVDKQPQWDIQANTLHIENIIPSVTALATIPDSVQQAISQVAPTGIIHNLRAKWFPEKTLLDSLSFTAELEKFSFNAYKDTVGAGNISGKIQGSIKQGHLDLDAEDFSLHIAKIYSKPWHYFRAKTTLNWSYDGTAISIFSPLMELKGEEGDLVGDMMIRLFPKTPINDYMDLRVNIANGDARCTPKYIPSKANMDPALVHWLKTSIKKGEIETGFFQYQGSLSNKAPPTAHTLLLYMKPRNAELDYQAPWLPIKQVDGEVFVDPVGVRVVAKKAVISNSQLTDIDVTIPFTKKPVVTHLYAKAKVISTLDDTLHILKNSPPELAKIFQEWQGKGNLTGDLQLDIPLAKNHQPVVVTNFTTKGAQLKLQHPIPPLTNISGSFRYDTNKGLSSPAVSAYAFGNLVRGSIAAQGNKGQPISNIKVKGTVDVTKLADWFLLPKQSWPFYGKTPYELELKIAKNNELKVFSDFEGVVLNLPAPFNKFPEQKQAFSYQMNFGEKQRTRLQVDYGSLISAAISMDSNQQDWRGELLINQGKATFSNKKGLQVSGNLGHTNIEDWQSLYVDYLSKYTSNSSNKVTDISKLRNVDIRIGQVTGFGIPIQQAALYMQPTGSNGWRLDINSASVAGRITAPQVNQLPFFVHLDHLKVPQALLDSLKKQNSVSNFNVSSIPSVNLSIQKLYLDEKLIGTINFENTVTRQGLKISNIALDLNGLYVVGNLDWNIGQNTSFNGMLGGKNLEDIMSRFDIEPTVTAKSFKVVINGVWAGSPADFAPENFTGILAPELNSGRLLSVDGSSTNILRIFGILNSEAINRRLRLDFTDLYKAGLSYDKIEGEFRVANGVLHINKPFSFEGPSMVMSMTGQINTKTQEVDANLRVGVPLGSNISIATLAVAPPIGGALLIADYFLGNQLMKIVAVNYSITGNWNNPVITLGSQ